MVCEWAPFLTPPERPPGSLVATLKSIVGNSYVLTTEAQTRRFRTGFRYGTGSVVAVVRPGSLVELWRVTNACVKANAIIIPQAANTGLTGGSTPCGDDYDRDVVLVSVYPNREATPD